MGPVGVNWSSGSTRPQNGAGTTSSCPLCPQVLGQSLGQRNCSRNVMREHILSFLDKEAGMESLLAGNHFPRSISGEQQSRSCGCKEPRPPPFPPGQDAFLQALHAWRPVPTDRRRRHHGQEPRSQAPATGAPVGRRVRRPPGSALRLRLGGATRGRSRRPGRPPPDRAALGAPHGPQTPTAGSCSPRAGSCGRGPGPASRPPPPRTTESRGDPGATAASPRGLRRPGPADDPLPPTERRPALTGCSLTRAMVAVAILRPSRPPRAPHAPAPSAVSRDLGASGCARRRREVSRQKAPSPSTREDRGMSFRCGEGPLRARRGAGGRGGAGTVWAGPAARTSFPVASHILSFAALTVRRRRAVQAQCVC
ncbi:wiskott-Aldrich syndrome protein homolog 1-like [Felis catus]|uniref:wiskott-Aldrich syndrome protein homolog 1-like n=1 Tax=Felis catus TaxID=9685 RepID=UPI001D19DD69|nr:wiskott-Aldrich syndrome protein homolog 1-like [Felis catus]